MCGRFVSSSPPDELARYFDATPPQAALGPPNYNVAPTDDVYVVVEDGGSRRLDTYRWGLVPSWATDVAVGSRLINARAESIATKAAFRAAFARRRCLVPADGFYEWSRVPGRRQKQPYFVHRTDDEPLALAGLWELWRDRGTATGEPGPGPSSWMRSCTIVTTTANETVARLHDRMPVVLPPSAWAAWLDPANGDVEALGRLLVPAPEGLVTYHAVSTDVSDVRKNGEHLVEPTSDGASGGGSDAGSGPGQPSLLDLLPPGEQG